MPGVRFGATESSVSLVDKLRGTPVSTFVMVTLASLIAPPDWSVIVPRMRPSYCARAVTEIVKMRMKTPQLFRRFIGPPSDLRRCSLFPHECAQRKETAELTHPTPTVTPRIP